MGGRFLGGVLAAALIASAAPAAAKCNLAEVGALPVSMSGVSPLIDANINGHPTRLVADSGAFFSTLDSDNAEKFKLKSLPERRIYMQGVGGWLSARIQTAETFEVLGHTFKNMDFVAAPESFGRSVSGLLGQNFLNVTDTEYDLANGVIRFFHADDCKDAMLAYWDTSQPYSVIPISKTAVNRRRIVGHVSVNGVDLPAVFDSGTGYSVLTLRGAMRAGIKKGDPRLEPGGVSGGIGRRLNQTWIAPVDSFKIGDEEIKHTRLRVSEMDLPDEDMLIGADFFLSHRVFVANSQQKLYLTYNGGPVFKLDVIPGDGSVGTEAGDGKTTAASVTPAAPSPLVASDASQDPKDADGFARRAEAFAARRDYARAFADFDRALALTPKDPTILYARGKIYAAKKEPKLALADFDEALRQKPGDLDMLMSRGQLHLEEKELALAKADFDRAALKDPSLMTSIAAAYTEEEDYPEALAEYDAWLSGATKTDEKVSGLNDKCWVRAKWNHELDKALEDCKAAIKLEPYWRSLLYTRGFLYLRMKRYDEAVHDLSQVIANQPRLSFALYCRGLAKKGAGKAAEGEADIKAATAIDPKVIDDVKKYGLIAEAAAKP